MKRCTVLSCLLVCLLVGEAKAQPAPVNTEVTIDSTKVDKPMVLGAGKITIGEKDTFSGVKLVLRHKLNANVEIAGYINLSPAPSSGKSSSWDGRWPAVPSGDYTMRIEVRFIQGMDAKTVSAEKGITVP